MAMTIQKKPKPAAETAPQVEVKQAVATVTKQHKDGSVEETKEVVAEQKFEGPSANVGVSMGLTKNLGDYNNIKFQVSIHMPCHPDAQDIEDTYEQCKAWVDSKVNAINEEIESKLGH